jgi:hypothetical protein
LEEHPELELWVEFACAAHLVDRHTPGFKESHAVDDLRSQDSRLTECAIAHAVENAIGRRRRALQEFYDPDALGEHLAAAARSALRMADGDACAQDRGRWQAGQRRLADVVRQLEKLVDQGEQSGSKLTAGVRERGFELRGTAPADQLAYLRSLPWARYRQEAQFFLLAGVATVQEQTKVEQLAPLLTAPRVGEESEDEREIVARACQVLTWPNTDDPAALVRMLVPARSGEPLSQGDNSGH